MENVMTNGFTELSANESVDINGGGGESVLWGAAVAFVALCVTVAEKSFNAGRQIVRDIRN